MSACGPSILSIIVGLLLLGANLAVYRGRGTVVRRPSIFTDAQHSLFMTALGVTFLLYGVITLLSDA